MVLLLASITPVMIFLYLINKRDKVKEPKALLGKCFAGGFISVVLALSIELPMEHLTAKFNDPLLKSFFGAFIGAAAPEEISKFIILYWIVWKSKYFSHYYDGIIYAVFVSMGFALIENILYVMDGGFSVALLRAVLAVPGHGFFAVLMGYQLSMAKFHAGVKRRNYILKAIFIPILFHGLYDFSIMYISNGSRNTILALALMVFFTFLVIRLWRMGIKKIRLYVKMDEENMVTVPQNVNEGDVMP